MGSYNDTDRAIHAGEFFHRNYIFHIAQAGPTIFGGKDDPQDSHLPQLFYDFQGKLRSLVPFHDMGRNFPFGEFTKGFSELQLFVRELEIQTASSIVDPGTANPIE